MQNRRNNNLFLRPCFFRLIWILGLGSWVFSPANAQTLIKETGIPFINQFSKKDYGGGTQNWDFKQADNGVLYIANNQGIMLYDGLDWELVPLPNGSVVRSLFKDYTGRIYAGGFNEFGYLDADSVNRIRFVSLSEAAGYPEIGEIWRIYEQDKVIYFQSYTAILCWDVPKDKWSVLRPKDRFDFLQSAYGELIINENKIGLHHLQNGRFTLLKGGEFFKEKEVWDIKEYDGSLLICTQNQGIFLYSDGKVSSWDTEVNQFILNNRFYCSSDYGPYFFWGSILDGMVISDHSGRVIKHINREVGLPNNTVLSLYPDREGTLWMGLDNGLAQLVTNIPLSDLTTAQDIGSGYAAALFEGKIYLGTNQGLFWTENFLDHRSGQELLSLNPVKELTSQVWSLQVAGDELLIGHNLGAFALKNGQIREIGQDPGGWIFVQVPERNDLMIAGSYYGLELFQKRPEGIKSLGKIDGFNESCRHLIFENEQTLWMGHGYEGIFRIQLSEDLTRATQVTCFADSSGLKTKNFNELLTVRPEVIVCNPTGFYRYEPRIGNFVPAETWSKIFSSGGRMTRLIRENQEKYWYFQESSAGQLRVINDTLMVKDEQILAPLEGSFIPSFENVSFLGDEDLIIGTDEGFVHLNPEWSGNFRSEFGILLKSITLFKNDSIIHFDYSNQQDDTLSIPSISYRFNDFRIHFDAPHLTFPEQTEYRYWLEEPGGGWSTWSDKNYAEFIALHEGDYHFHIQARSIFGIEARELLVELSISTPWYRSILAYVTYLTILIVATILAWFLVRKNLEREKRRALLKEKRQMLHRQMKLKRDSELAEREIVKLRNDKLRADVRHKSKELANQTMGIIQKNKFLTDIKDEMVRLRNQAQNDEVRSSMKRMIRKIDRNIEDEDALKIFETNFDQVHENFLTRLRQAYPQLTAKDLRLCAYLRLNLSSKEISPLLNISVRGVEISRYRLRKKLNLDHTEHLADFILRF